ncbi:putative disease resistance RPP13-like protein 1 [Bienertia sinuspersici]
MFDVKLVTTIIFKSAVDFSTLDEAQKAWKQVLTSRRFLIVLDDIWNDEYGVWNQLHQPFQHDGKGSRMIITTRNEEIARMMNNWRT